MTKRPKVYKGELRIEGKTRIPGVILAEDFSTLTLWGAKRRTRRDTAGNPVILH